jgi:hypothetical protein
VWKQFSGRPLNLRRGDGSALAYSCLTISELEVELSERQTVIADLEIGRLLSKLKLPLTPVEIPLCQDRVRNGLLHLTCRLSQRSQTTVLTTTSPLAPMIAKSSANMLERVSWPKPEKFGEVGGEAYR